MCLNTQQVPEVHVSVEALISHSEQGAQPGPRWGLERERGSEREMKDGTNGGRRGGG